MKAQDILEEIKEEEDFNEWSEVQSDSGIWLPTKAGDFIEGIVIDKFNGQWGDQVIIEISPGVQRLSPSHKILQAKLRNLKVGTFIRIVYNGIELPTTKGKQGARKYSVYQKVPMRKEVEI